MRKKINQKKVFKGIMVGAVAFTPVIAIGMNVEKANAAGEATAQSIAAEYYSSEMTQQKKEILDIILSNVRASIGDFIVDGSVESESQLAGDLNQYLLDVPSSSSQGDLQSKLERNFNLFVDAESGNVPDTKMVQNLVNYIASTQGSILNDLQSTNLNSSSDLLAFFNQTFDTLENNRSLHDVSSIIAFPNQETDALISRIFNDVDNYLNPSPEPEEPILDNGQGEVSTGSENVEENPEQVIEVINQAETVDELVINVSESAEQVSVPASIFLALAEKNTDAVVILKIDEGSYEIPVSTIDLVSLAEELEVTSVELKVVIVIKTVQTPALVDAQYEILSPSIEFEISVVAPNGDSIPVNYFPHPIKRTINAFQPLDTLTTVGVTVVNGQVRGVPTFVTNENDMKSANIYRSSNSTYTLVENFKTFSDVDNGANWSEEYVEKLASRMVINGTTATAFSPGKSITRGEFAAMLARGLGLEAENKNVPFSDVSLNQAINKNGEIAAVFEAGIIDGYHDGKFRPEKSISRSEAAIMISKALSYYGEDKLDFNTSKDVTDFKDWKSIGKSSKNHIERVYEAGFINGYSNGQYRPDNTANRAEIAKILYNYLAEIEFIN